MTLYVIEKFSEKEACVKPTGNVSTDYERLAKLLEKVNSLAPGPTRRIQAYSQREGVIKNPPKLPYV